MDPKLAEALQPFLEFAMGLARAPEFMPVTQGSPMALRQLLVGDFQRLVNAVNEHNLPIQTQDEIAARIKLPTNRAEAEAMLAVAEFHLTPPPEEPKSYTIDHDGFHGSVQGHYVTREGKKGVVLQQIGTKVVHVYGEKWLK